MTEQNPDTYDIYSEHLSTCEECDSKPPLPGEEDFMCAPGVAIKARWLEPDPRKARVVILAQAIEWLTSAIRDEKRWKGDVTQAMALVQVTLDA